jgi:hypothetical protein
LKTHRLLLTISLFYVSSHAFAAAAGAPTKLQGEGQKRIWNFTMKVTKPDPNTIEQVRNVHGVHDGSSLKEIITLHTWVPAGNNTFESSLFIDVPPNKSIDEQRRELDTLKKKRQLLIRYAKLYEDALHKAADQLVNCGYNVLTISRKVSPQNFKYRFRQDDWSFWDDGGNIVDQNRITENKETGVHIRENITLKKLPDTKQELSLDLFFGTRAEKLGEFFDQKTLELQFNDIFRKRSLLAMSSLRQNARKSGNQQLIKLVEEFPLFATMEEEGEEDDL